ncbi:MAG: sigma-70 family RNA polymerase sigma factor [Bacteroidales bacterium]|nr:sigma-70 family RNA polymerase sigma factor [Bacteroidales bacterium]
MKKQNNKRKVSKQLTAAQQQLVVDNMAFADKQARKYRASGEMRGIALADLTQEARLGLCLAAADFNPERGVTFITFAFNICRKQMQLLIRPQHNEQCFVDKDVERLNVIDDAEDCGERAFQVEERLQVLGKKEREVVCLVYGLEGDPKGFGEIAKELGLTNRRVHQIYEKAMGKMENF